MAKKQDEKNTRKSSLIPRPPVVTVMGHIDHGKTTLLDAIRQTNVVEKEFGGITQHIGAYQVEIVPPKSQEKKKITFIDTPGHEAFTKMRSRGASATDIVVLVVAANDGVMPQTREAIDHAKAAGVPMIVAINKIDLPGTEPEAVKKQLVKAGVLVEGYGGSVPAVEISAKEKRGIDELLEMILLVAELEEFKTDPKAPFEGVIIESHLDDKKGPVATVLVKNGTLAVGQNIGAGRVAGKVKALIDDKGQRLNRATASVPVEVLGFSEVPGVGLKVGVAGVKNEFQVREKVAKKPVKSTGKETFNLIVKADTEGAREAVVDALKNLKVADLKINVISANSGDISKSDIFLAKASEAIVVGFNVSFLPDVARLAEAEKVKVKFYQVIYELLHDLEKEVKKLLEPEVGEKILGRGEIIAEFEGTKARIAGVKVLEGVLRVGDLARVLRGEKLVGESPIATMRHQKEDVKRAIKDSECGITFTRGLDFKKGDVVECYRLKG